MPIHLTTGLPGAGKTLSTIVRVKQKSEQEGRPVFYHGIKDLALPWIPLDNPEKWYECPEGAIIVLVECQMTFRPRSNGAPVPQHVKELETHRHKGHDLFLDTQHPMLIDGNVRRLVGKHWHVIRKFGFETANVHEWNAIRDNPDKNRKDSIQTTFTYPKDAYTYYKSAEVHTVKAKLPTRIKLLLLIPPLVIGFMYGAYKLASPQAQHDHIFGKPNDVKTNQPVTSKGNDAPSKSVSDLTYVQAHQAEISDFPHTAPIYKEVTKPVTAPYPAACLQSRSQGCKCFTQQGTMLQTSQEVCQQIVKQGFFIEWDQHTEQAKQELKDSPIGVSGRSPDVDRPPLHLTDMPLRASPGQA